MLYAWLFSFSLTAVKIQHQTNPTLDYDQIAFWYCLGVKPVLSIVIGQIRTCFLVSFFVFVGCSEECRYGAHLFPGRLKKIQFKTRTGISWQSCIWVINLKAFVVYSSPLFYYSLWWFSLFSIKTTLSEESLKFYSYSRPLCHKHQMFYTQTTFANVWLRTQSWDDLWLSSSPNVSHIFCFCCQLALQIVAILLCQWNQRENISFFSNDLLQFLNALIALSVWPLVHKCGWCRNRCFVC